MRTSGERPILFSGEMVRALLAGTKTQTRRIVKPGPPPCQSGTTAMYNYRHGWRYTGVDYACERDLEVCPYGKSGDRLWVRESYYQLGHWESLPGVKTKTGRMKWRFVADSPQIVFDPEQCELTATGPIRKGRHHRDPGTIAWHKRLGRFMLRKYSRITLEITEVRVQRLQDISEEDAIAEGVEHPETFRDEAHKELCPQCGGTGLYTAFSGTGGAMPDTDCQLCDTHIKRFRHLWESISRAGSWDANPWVWAVSFKVVDSGL